jgi:hypothetical protein
MHAARYLFMWGASIMYNRVAKAVLLPICVLLLAGRSCIQAPRLLQSS